MRLAVELGLIRCCLLPKIMLPGGVSSFTGLRYIEKGLLPSSAIDVFLQGGKNWHGLCCDTLQADFLFFKEISL